MWLNLLAASTWRPIVQPKEILRLTLRKNEGSAIARYIVPLVQRLLLRGQNDWGCIVGRVSLLCLVYYYTWGATQYAGLRVAGLQLNNAVSGYCVVPM